MARQRLSGELGDKIGPKLADLVLRYQLAARRGLAPHEAKVRQVAAQALIDRAGHEVADHYEPLLRPLLAGEHGDMHPLMKEHLSRASAGSHQWHSLSSLLGMGMQSALSGAISNAVAPIAYEINSIGPNLNADPQVWAAGVAAGYADMGTGQSVAHKNGLGGGNFGLMVNLAAAIPDAGTLQQLVNRGIISEDDALSWLHKAAVPEALRRDVMALRRQLVTPADAALAVLRGNISRARGNEYANASGLNDDDFGLIISNTGEPLGLMQLLEAYRRGIINEETLKRGILQSRVRDEWIPAAIALRYEPMSTADAADAALRGHLTQAQAKTIAEQNGLRPDDWAPYFANQGNPPADIQLLELWRRGFINEQQVDKGLREGRVRDEWIPQVKDLRYEPLSTADAIDAWLRGHLTRQAAETIVEENGLLPRDVTAAFDNAGSPLALEQLLEAYRRGFITEQRLETGLRESRLRDDWIGTAVQLRHSPMSTADAIEASIQGYITKDRASKISEQNGLDPADFGPLWDTAGQPLSRTELEELYNRGEIPADVVRQGLRESRLKDKYVDDALKLHVRLAEPREVTAALTDGVITREQAIKMLGDMGYQHDTVTMLIAAAETKATGPHRQLMTGEISALYSDRIISRERATGLLEQLHFTAQSAGMILDLADYQLQRRILNSGITAIRSHYLAGRIDEVTAAADLHALNLPPSASSTYLKVWSLDKLAHPKQLTEAQIIKAYKLTLFVPENERTTPQGTQRNTEIAKDRLVALGYSPGDAQLLMDGA